MLPIPSLSKDLRTHAAVCLYLKSGTRDSRRPWSSTPSHILCINYLILFLNEWDGCMPCIYAGLAIKKCCVSFLSDCVSTFENFCVSQIPGVLICTDELGTKLQAILI
jgi:hypothetical protein